MPSNCKATQARMSIDIDDNPLKSDENKSCTCFRNAMRVIRSVCQFPSNVINAWGNNTTLQKVMGTAAVIYCTAATVYIIYLESQNTQTPIGCLSEIKNTSLLLGPSSLEEAQESSENYGHVLYSVFKKCEEQFEKSGAEKTSLSGSISMQICYPIINRVCKASEDILQIMSKLNKTAKATREHPTLNDINRVNNHLQYIKGKFSCNGKGAFLIN